MINPIQPTIDLHLHIPIQVNKLILCFSIYNMAAALHLSISQWQLLLLLFLTYNVTIYRQQSAHILKLRSIVLYKDIGIAQFLLD